VASDHCPHSPGNGPLSIPRKSTTLPLAAAALAVVAALAFIAAKDPHYDIRPGARAENAQCARMVDEAPDRLAGKPHHSTGIPGVVVWGDNEIVLRCGVPEPGPTTDPCFAADGVDWVLHEKRSTEGGKVITTYGRSPATEVTFTGSASAPDAALVELSALVAPIKQTAQCIQPD